MNAHPIIISFLSLSPVNSLPSFSSITLFYFLSFTLTASLSPWILLSFSLHFSQQLSPLWYLLLSCWNFTPPSSLILTHSVYEESKKTISCIELQHQFDTLQNVSMFFSAGPKNVQKHILNHWFGENIIMMRSSRAWPKQANTLYRIYSLNKSTF